MVARRLGWSLLVALGLAAGAWVLCACQPINPAPLSFTVNTSADHPDVSVGDGICDDGTGHCSLRAAIDEANASASPGMHTITLATNVTLTIAPSAGDTSANQEDSGDLDVASRIRIMGQHHMIQATNHDRILDQHQGDLVLDDVTLNGGIAGAGADQPAGGALRAEGNVVIEKSRLTFNRATGTASRGGAISAGPSSNVIITDSRIADNASNDLYGDGMSGGAIASDGALAIVGSTIDGNTAKDTLITNGHGGGITFSGSTLSISDSTISNNVAQSTGGALLVQSGQVSISDSTISGNQAQTGDGGAIRVDGGSVDLTSVTVADNSSSSSTLSGAGISSRGSLLGTRTSALCSDPVTSNGWNVAVDTSCGLDELSDLQSATTGLGPLAANGGPTATRLPFAGSSAVDAIPVGTPGLCDSSTPPDQRGIARPVGGACDAGAVEGSGAAAVPHAFVVNSGADTQDVNQGDGICADATGHCTLRAAVNEANASPAADSITVGPGVVLAPLTQGALWVNEAVTIDGNGAVVNGNQSTQVIHQIAGRLTISHLTIERGSGDGGGVGSRGDLNVTRVVFGGTGSGLGNQSSTNGGAIDHLGRGSLAISQSTFAGNQAAGAGGAIYLGSGGVGTITDSTFTLNGVVLPEKTWEFPSSGGGAIANDGTLGVSDSTLSVNADGAVLQHAGSTTITSSTLSRNELGPTLRTTGGALTVSGSILDPASGGACSGPVTSGGYNLSNDQTCALTGTGDQQGVAPLLGALLPNGGSTATQLPYLGSPAVDAIPFGTPRLCTGSTPDDQRGVTRPQGPACDIGAVEGSSAAAISPLHLTVDVSTDARDAHPGDGVCDDGTGHCPLRAAIDETNARPGIANTITIAPGVDPTLTIPGIGEDANATGDLDVAGMLTIEGNGATVDANHLDNGIDVEHGSLTLHDISVVHAGGADIFAKGDVTLDHVTLSGATGPFGGGAVMEPGTNLVMTDSIVTDNHVGLYCGGLSIGGRATIERSTISNNSSNNSGGILTGWLGQAGGEVTIENSTITGNSGTTTINSSAEGSGLAADSVVHVIRSTIASNNQTGLEAAAYGSIDVAGSIVQTDYGPACQLGTSGAITSNGGNVGSDASCFLTAPLDRPSVDPLLGILANNGGPTPTRMVIAGSPAIDAIPTGAAGLCDPTGLVDQRGVTRPQGPGCDAGAVEGFAPAPPPENLVVDTAADTHDANPGDGICDDGTGHCSLRAAIDETNAAPTADHITIAPGVNPTLTIPGRGDADNVSGDLNIRGDLSIDGGGATLNAAGLDRAITVLDHTVSISSLTITGGAGTSSLYGAGIYARGDLTLHDVTITGNNAGDFAGGMYVTGSLTMTDSTVSGNSSTYSPGGIDLQGTDSTISDSTISGNTSSVYGGAIDTGGTNLRIERSTISGNVSPSSSTVFAVNGLEIVDSTITGNTATGSAAVQALGTGVEITASTIAGDTAPSELDLAASAVVSGTVVGGVGSTTACQAPVTSGGWNLATDATCGLTQASDVQGVAPLLGALANNGGPTLTLLPLSSSPLIDKIPIGTPGLCDGTIATDQRGITRPQGTACDIGSVEQ
jgi:CSLREA domain-containing protein